MPSGLNTKRKTPALNQGTLICCAKLMENFLKLMAFAHKKEAAHSQEKTDHVQLIKNSYYNAAFR